MAEWYLSDKPIRLICIRNSWSCITDNYAYSNIFVECDSECFTKQLDFGASYLNWVGIWCGDKYCGAHQSDRFISLFKFRDERIRSILDE
jgi:hypothetical protein